MLNEPSSMKMVSIFSSLIARKQIRVFPTVLNYFLNFLSLIFGGELFPFLFSFCLFLEMLIFFTFAHDNVGFFLLTGAGSYQICLPPFLLWPWIFLPPFTFFFHFTGGSSCPHSVSFNDRHKWNSLIAHDVYFPLLFFFFFLFDKRRWIPRKPAPWRLLQSQNHPRLFRKRRKRARNHPSCLSSSLK